MRLLKDNNDRVLFGALSVGALVLASTMLMTPQISFSFGTSPASAALFEPAQPNYHTQAAHGPVPSATTIHKLVKTEGPIDIVRDPADVPPPGWSNPDGAGGTVVEVTGKLADGATYRYWTFNQKVPGPFVRVRVGDTVEVKLHN